MKHIQVLNKTYYLAGTSLYADHSGQCGQMPICVLKEGRVWLRYTDRTKTILDTPFGIENESELALIAIGAYKEVAK